ncbi:hypothetical protein C8J57DRAFT_1228020 [Mycena rebaudengoi]|nr:hypothetical protein C8J57DRAFT_1228020 [Mycena rebaudengoi]
MTPNWRPVVATDFGSAPLPQRTRPRVGELTRVLKVAEFGYGVGEVIGTCGSGGTRNGVEMPTTTNEGRSGQLRRAIGGTGNLSGPKFRVGEYLGYWSEGVTGWVWGMAKPGADKCRRTAGGGTEKRSGRSLEHTGENKDAKWGWCRVHW